MPIGSLIQLIALGLGIGEQVIPLFIHNPKSQQIEAAIFTTVNNVLSAFSTAIPPAPVTSAPTPASVPASQLAQGHTQPLVTPSGPAGVYPPKP